MSRMTVWRLNVQGKKVKVEVDEEEEEEEDVKPDINQLNNAVPPVKPHYWIYQVGYSFISLGTQEYWLSLTEIQLHQTIFIL